MTAFPEPLPLLIAYLAPILAPIHVGSEVPVNRPTEFIQVRRVGGPALPPVRQLVRVDVFAWAATEERALQVGGYVREALWALQGLIIGGVPVYEIGEFMGPTMTEDDQTRTPQLWTTYELTMRADGAIHRA